MASATCLLALSAGTALAATPITVVNHNDSGAGSLRQALLDVDAGGTIVIPASVGEVTLTSGELVVDRSVTIQGAASSQTAISGDNLSRVLHIEGSPTVTVSGAQIINGKVAVAGGSEAGGGILVDSGSLTLSGSVVTEDTVDTTGTTGGISEGGGIDVNSAGGLTLLNSTVSDDRALAGSSGDAWGGGIYDTGSLVIVGGSVDGNTVSGGSPAGGGVYYTGPTGATLENLSVTGNLVEPARAHQASTPAAADSTSRPQLGTRSPTSRWRGTSSRSTVRLCRAASPRGAASGCKPGDQPWSTRPSRETRSRRTS